MFIDQSFIVHDTISEMPATGMKFTQQNKNEHEPFT